MGRLCLIVVFLFLFSSQLFREGLGEGRYRVLFDAGHGESAGRHADWIIDDDSPIPSPRDPKSPEEWSGGISSWAYELHKSGRYEVESTRKPITFGAPQNPQDLSNFDVLVLCEPNKNLSPSELQAVVTFVKEGGGLFLVADHFGSDRDNDGTDSTGIFNQLEKETGIHFQGKGETNAWLQGGHQTSNFCPLIDADDYYLFQGPFGVVERVYLHGFGTMRALRDFNTSVQGHIWMKGSMQTGQDILFATSRLGQGRIVALSDSSVVDDGTTQSPGKKLYNGWLAEGFQNNRLVLNATEFLAKKEREVKGK